MNLVSWNSLFFLLVVFPVAFGDGEVFWKLFWTRKSGKWIKFFHYATGQFFALSDDGKKQAINVVELSQNGVKIIEGQTLKEKFCDVFSSAHQKMCFLLGKEIKKLCLVFQLSSITFINFRDNLIR